MDRFKNVAKKGWHPERSSSSTGSSGGQSDSKLGQVKGWVGKAQGKVTNATSSPAPERQSAPLSTLRDPSTFAPPPKRLDYNRNTTAANSGGSSSTPQEEGQVHRPPPVSHRPNTSSSSSTTTTAARPKPSLPPRLPPRQNSNPDAYAPPPPPTYNEATQQGTASEGVLNQGALGRLGQAGVSVPGFGIGRTASPPVPPRRNPSPQVPPRENSFSRPPPSPALAGHGAQMGELQSRFGKMSTPTSEAPNTGTSWADKQAALRTAGSLRDDPSKVTASDLKGAASTANNFQQRHGEQVAGGWKAASGLNQKYGIAGKMNNIASSSASPGPASPLSPTGSSHGGLGKKAPPPPPPKKKELGGNAGEPPPIPLSSKPKF